MLCCCYSRKLSRRKISNVCRAFFESAHGFFYSATHHPDAHTSMPFVSITTRVSASGVDDVLGLRSEYVQDGIEPILAFIHPDDIERYVEARNASQLVLSPLCLELRINHPMKGERCVELKSLPQREPDGATTWHGFMCDITDFKRSEAFLFERCEHDQHLSNIVENLPGFVYTFRQSPDGVFSFPYVSVGIRKLFGLEPEELLHGIAPVMDMIHADDHSGIIDSIATSACEMSVLNCTYRMTFPALGERWMSARSMPQRAADGGILWHGVMLDVTEQKQMEEALVAREQESRTLIENSPDVITRYDRNCRRLFANPAFGAEVEVESMPSLLRARSNRYS